MSQAQAQSASSQENGRVCNFSAGPAALPLSVLKSVRQDLLNYKGSGMSVMEMSHRSSVFDAIWKKAEADMRHLLGIPAAYRVFFLQGGATTQFSCIPLNLGLRLSTGPDGRQKKADCLITGNWSKKAVEEARRLGGADSVNVVCNTLAESEPGARVPPYAEWSPNLTRAEQSCYLHLCVNETVHGNTMHDFGWIDEYKKTHAGVPIVADFSSSFMSSPIDVAKFDLIYAGAQKNIGPAGVTVVIVKDSLIDKDVIDPLCPVLLSYATHQKKAIYNTPPCFSVYVMGLVFEWIRDEVGSLSRMHERNVRKAQLIYDVIDQSGGFYLAPVQKRDRSFMNIRFNLRAGKHLEARFLKDGAKLGFVNMKGYRTLGGIRISVYNSQPIENCARVARFMRDFQKRHETSKL